MRAASELEWSGYVLLTSLKTEQSVKTEMSSPSPSSSPSLLSSFLSYFGPQTKEIGTSKFPPDKNYRLCENGSESD